jgi:hypothetical protein
LLTTHHYSLITAFVFFLLTIHHSALTPCANAQGIITTVAGSGRTLRGAGGPATSAALGNLVGLAQDSSGNIFASDTDNHYVVKISPAGILTIVAGNGVEGFSGDGGPAR